MICCSDQQDMYVREDLQIVIFHHFISQLYWYTCTCTCMYHTYYRELTWCDTRNNSTHVFHVSMCHNIPAWDRRAWQMQITWWVYVQQLLFAVEVRAVDVNNRMLFFIASRILVVSFQCKTFISVAWLYKYTKHKLLPGNEFNLSTS